MRTMRSAGRTGVLARMCVACGYAGPEMQAEGEDAALACPRCGQDLYERPVRSYAEMEGLGVEVVAPLSRVTWLRRQVRLLRDWAFIWMAFVKRPGAR